MTFDDYLKLMVRFKGIIKGYPESEDAFKMHFALISLKIKDLRTLKRAMHKHLLSSDFFPTHKDLLVHLLPEFRKIDPMKVIEEADEYHKSIKEILCTRYFLAIPQYKSWEYRNATSQDLNQWITSIGIKLNKLLDDYRNLKIDPDSIFTLEVKEFLESKKEVSNV